MRIYMAGGAYSGTGHPNSLALTHQTTLSTARFNSESLMLSLCVPGYHGATALGRWYGALVKINKRACGHHRSSAALRVFIFGLVSKSPVRRIDP
jgi:hypothetical protein